MHQRRDTDHDRNRTCSPATRRACRVAERPTLHRLRGRRPSRARDRARHEGDRRIDRSDDRLQRLDSRADAARRSRLRDHRRRHEQRRRRDDRPLARPSARQPLRRRPGRHPGADRDRRRLHLPGQVPRPRLLLVPPPSARGLRPGDGDVRDDHRRARRRDLLAARRSPALRSPSTTS